MLALYLYIPNSFNPHIYYTYFIDEGTEAEEF